MPSRSIDLALGTEKQAIREARHGNPNTAGSFRSFEDAFSARVGSCRMTCSCGRIFYNPDGGWDWEDGELEELRANPKATELAWAAGAVEFEGRSYVTDCNCWHERAKRIIAFVIGHSQEIADFLTAERARRIDLAERFPVVK